MRPLYVLAHADCYDGFGALYLCHKLLKVPKANLIMCKWGSPFPSLPANSDILIFDFSFPRDVLIEQHERAHSLKVFDHHKSAQKDLEGLEFCTFDMNRSGVLLAWDYLNPRKPSSPWWVMAIDDRDRWQLKLKYTKEVMNAFASIPFIMEAWDEFIEGGVIKAIYEGQIIGRYKERLIEQAMGNVFQGKIGKYTVPIVNISSLNLLSETLGYLAKDKPFAAGFYFNEKGEKVWSLRSTPDGVDVSEIAREYGGGGHRGAAGFRGEV